MAQRGLGAEQPMRGVGGRISDIWMATPVRVKTNTGHRAALRPIPKPRHHSELFYLASAVIAQAAKDADPEFQRGGRPRTISEPIRERQFRALIWLTGADPDLVYWTNLADYPIHALHRRYRPRLEALCHLLPALADRMMPKRQMSPCA